MVQPDAFNRFAPPPRSFAFDHSNNRSVVVLGLHMRKCAGTAVRRMFADTGLLFCLFHPHISAPCRQLLLAVPSLHCSPFLLHSDKLAEMHEKGNLEYHGLRALPQCL